MAVDLTLAKQHLRVDHSDEDALIAQYLAAAIAWVENYTGKLMTRREVTQEADCFGSYVPLLYGPDPVNLLIDYTDADDASATIADALIKRGRAYPAASWPTVADNTSIVLTYTAGYTETPADLDSAVLLLVGHYYENREAVVVGSSSMISNPLELAVESLCRPYRALRI